MFSDQEALLIILSILIGILNIILIDQVYIDSKIKIKIENGFSDEEVEKYKHVIYIITLLVVIAFNCLIYFTVLLYF